MLEVVAECVLGPNPPLWGNRRANRQRLRGNVHLAVIAQARSAGQVTPPAPVHLADRCFSPARLMIAHVMR
jgi:hypothetical protein